MNDCGAIAFAVTVRDQDSGYQDYILTGQIAICGPTRSVLYVDWRSAIETTKARRARAYNVLIDALRTSLPMGKCMSLHVVSTSWLDESNLQELRMIYLSADQYGNGKWRPTIAKDVELSHHTPSNHSVGCVVGLPRLEMDGNRLPRLGGLNCRSSPEYLHIGREPHHMQIHKHACKRLDRVEVRDH